MKTYFVRSAALIALASLVLPLSGCGSESAPTPPNKEETTKVSFQEKQDEEKPEQSEQVLKVGDKAPDFEITGLENKKIKLSERFGEKGQPVVLLFSRANW